MERARTDAELALQLSLENDERQFQGMSTMWLGSVIAKAEPTQIEALGDPISSGIRLLEELGKTIYLCLSYLWLGEVYAESGRREETLENLKKAETIFLEMGMDYWLGRTREVLARL